MNTTFISWTLVNNILYVVRYAQSLASITFEKRLIILIPLQTMHEKVIP